MITRRVHQAARFVWSRDPALDKSDPSFEEKWKVFLENEDVAALPLRDGQKPTVFRLASLKREQVLSIGVVMLGAEDLLRRADMIVAAGLVGVENFVDEAGRPLELAFEDDGRGGKRLSKESMDWIFFVPLILELGTRIWGMSTPDPLSGRA